jgi:hypothetical protein
MASDRSNNGVAGGTTLAKPIPEFKPWRELGWMFNKEGDAVVIDRQASDVPTQEGGDRVVEITHVDDNCAESATIELDDLTVRLHYSGAAEKLEEASSEVRPTHQFELSRQELARDYRRLGIH